MERAYSIIEEYDKKDYFRNNNFFDTTKPIDKIKLASGDMFLGEKITNKYSIVPIIVVFSLLFVIMVLGCTQWSATFKQDIFETIHTKVTTFEIKLPHFNITTEGIDVGMEKIAIFGKLMGNVTAFGTWSYVEMSIMVLIATFVIGLFYRIKLKDTYEYMADGAKKIARPALLVLFIYTVIYFTGNSMFYPTIAKHILGITKEFNLIFTTITTILGSFLHIDMLYLTSYVIPQISAQSVDGTIIAILSQGLYATTMFIAPTSVGLAFGLSYLGISYKEWIKRTWKLALLLLAAVLAVTILAMIII